MEPDPHIREMLSELFLTQGYEVVQEARGKALITRVIELEPDVVLVAQETVDGEDSDSIPLLRRLMDGIIVVVGESGEGQVVGALLGGADIYIKRPVNYRELLARVRAFRRRGGLGYTA